MPLIIESYRAVEASVRIASAASGVALAQLLPPQAAVATGIQLGLTRLSVQLRTAVASNFGLITPTAVGTATTPLVGNMVSRQAGGFPAIGLFASAWSAAPTYAATPYYYRQADLPATALSSFEWTWPEDDPFTWELDPYTAVNLNAGRGVVLRNIGAGASADVTVSMRWLEYRYSQIP